MFIKIGNVYEIGPVKACMFTNIDHISQKDIKIAPSNFLLWVCSRKKYLATLFYGDVVKKKTLLRNQTRLHTGH